LLIRFQTVPHFMPVSLPVTFFFPYPSELADLDRHDLTNPSFDNYHFYSEEGQTRRRGWLLQTYLWLRHSGYEVSISDTLPQEGIVVVLPEAFSLSQFYRQYGRAHRSLFILTIRADIYGFRSSLGDADIVQNGRFSDEERTFFVPHWPQPGLRPRDPSRGFQIRTLVFKGGYGNLHSDFRSAVWKNYLEQRGLTFQISSAETEGKIPSWRDYRTADLNVAVRPSFNDGGLRFDKPASKLVNAWHAGVPSLLGKEYAYQELRQSPLDYIEIETIEEAMTAIDQLLEHPILYRDMIDNGLERARAFTPERIAARWAEVLFDFLPEIASTRAFRLSRSLPLPARRVSNFATMPPSSFELRKKVGQLIRTLSPSES
jgi:glycosyltransferase involved in cell wall biosynthesis